MPLKKGTTKGVISQNIKTASNTFTVLVSQTQFA